MFLDYENKYGYDDLLEIDANDFVDLGDYSAFRND